RIKLSADSLQCSACFPEYRDLRHNTGMDGSYIVPSIPSHSQNLKSDIEAFLKALVGEVLTTSDAKLRSDAELHKKIIDAAAKGLGKLTEETIKSYAKAQGWADDISLPMTSFSGVIVEEIGRGFAGSIIAVYDSRDKKLRQLLDQSLRAGFD